MAPLRPPLTPMPPGAAGAAAGDPASGAALRRLGGHLQAIRAQAVQPLLHKALAALRAGRREEAAMAAQRALDLDGGCGLAWHILAICQEKTGNFTGALDSYEQALAHLPDEPEIANDLGRLALKMGMPELAEALFQNYLTRRPDSIEGANNLACAQRDLFQFDEAIETLRGAIAANPEAPMLWNALGGVLTLRGQIDQARVFYDEAVRLDPDFASALYNRGGARLALGDAAGALADLDRAIALCRQPAEAAGMRVARAKALLAAGEIAKGWEAYEARLDPLYEDAAIFLCDRPVWSPDMDLEGRRLLLIGEQGLGDEVLFANVIPDMVRAVGPKGELAIAVEQRLVSLFARSFPDVAVSAHATLRVDHHAVRGSGLPETRLATFDAWAPLASPLRRFRTGLGDFPEGPFLTPDPKRVAHWRSALADLPGLKLGVLWKSLIMTADRSRYFAPFEDWAPVLGAPGISLVTLQYGDCAAEEEALAAAGVALWRPPGLDLKDDLDEIAALTCALDLVVGPANATTNIAAACGAEIWLLSTVGSWPRLGTERHPWYPSMRVFTPRTCGDWRPALEDMAAALAGRIG